MRHHRRSSFTRRLQRSWQSISYRRRRWLYKGLVGLLGGALSILVAWMIVELLS